MNNQRVEPQKRLNLLMQENQMKISQLSSATGESINVIKNYKSGRQLIPVDFAQRVADEFNVTLDWFYGRSDNRNHSDIIADVLASLDKVFYFTCKHNQKTGERYPVLLIDRQFYNFINEMHRLKETNSDSEMLAKWQESARKELFLKYKEYFKSLFESVGFNENNAVELRNYEGLTIVDLIATAATDK